MEPPTPRNTFVKITWTLIALVLPFPLLQLLPYSAHRYRLPEPRPDTIIGIAVWAVVGVYVMYWFLLWVSGKFVAGGLAVLAMVIFFKPSIPERTRLITTIVGLIASALLLWWVSIVKHQW